MRGPGRYRKLPVTIDAWQIPFDPAGQDALLTWINGEGGEASLHSISEDTQPWLVIHTLEGPMRAEVGDWVIRGVAGEFYGCRADIFATTYEAVAG